MGRTVKRVPLDFDWELRKIWYGYLRFVCGGSCEDCKKYAKIKGIPLKSSGCPDFNIEPPTGEGYQLWDTTTEGMPVTPVFKTPEELAQYCETNCTIHGSTDMSYDKWLSFIKGESVDVGMFTYSCSSNNIMLNYELMSNKDNKNGENPK